MRTRYRFSKGDLRPWSRAVETNRVFWTSQAQALAEWIAGGGRA